MRIGFRNIAEGELDVERLIEKKMEYDFKNSNGKTGHQIKQEEKRKNKELKFEHNMKKAEERHKKTRYQIKQEEKRKNEELEFKQTMQILKIIGIVLLIGFIFIGIMAYIEQH